MKSIYKSLILAPALLTLASCSNDEPGFDSGAEGKLPMDFSIGFADEAPMTRLTSTGNDMGCKWNNGDKISINVNQAGIVSSSIATLDANGVITNLTPTLYWSSSNPAAVTAWYSNVGDISLQEPQTVSIADQSAGPAYILQGETTAEFGKTANVQLHHSLAKVRVRLTGEEANLEGTVKVRNYSTCTVDRGTVTGLTPGYITMHRYDEGCYEATVVPTDKLELENFISLDDGRVVTVSGPTQIEAGYSYLIVLKVS